MFQTEETANISPYDWNEFGIFQGQGSVYQSAIAVIMLHNRLFPIHSVFLICLAYWFAGHLGPFKFRHVGELGLVPNFWTGSSFPHKSF